VEVKPAPTNEKTQTSSTPMTPEQKEEDLPNLRPVVKINLQFQPIPEITKSACYVKYVPPVFVDSCTFDFCDADYELSTKDRDFLRADHAETVGVSEHDLERTIDCLEKVAFLYKDTQPTQVAKYFLQHADEDLLRKLKKPQIEYLIAQYWKKRRIEQKWHVFNRKFWENPDYNEPDLSAAFRKKSEKEKIKTRPKLEIHKKKLQNGERARDQTVQYVLEDLLPSLFQREAQKQAIDRIRN
jgi:hypothetical protein